MRRILLVALMGALGTTGAFASLELELTSGGVTSGVTIGAGGIVSFSGTVGDWNINLTSGTSFSPTAITDLGSIDATSTAGAPALVIELTDTGFAPNSNSFVMTDSGHLVSGTGTSTISAYYSNTNDEFGTGLSIAGAVNGAGTLIGTMGPFSSAYATSGSFGAAATAPFSLTQVLTLTSGGAGTEWSTDSSIAPVPEPTSILLLGSVMVGVTQILRRRAKKA